MTTLRIIMTSLIGYCRGSARPPGILRAKGLVASEHVVNDHVGLERGNHHEAVEYHEGGQAQLHEG